MTKFDDDIDKFIKDTKQFANLKRLPVKDVKAIAQTFIGKMKEEIARGLSPITRKKFPRYKDTEKYPGKLKAHAPVNLELSGDMLSDLKTEAVITTGTEIYILLKYATRRSSLKEQGHREGANGQPKRPTLPQGRENFSDHLTKSLEADYAALMERKFDI